MTNLRCISFTEEWGSALDGFIRTQPECGPLHTRSWSRVLRRSLGDENHSIVAIRGDSIVGFLPLFLVRHPLLGAKAISLPIDVCFGGAVAAERGVVEQLTLEARKMMDRYRLQFVEIRTMHRQEWMSELGFAEASPLTYSIVSLRSRDENWRLMKKDARWSVGKSAREGVVVRASDNPDDLAAFHRILAQAFRSFASPIWEQGVFRNMRDFLEPGQFRLLIAEHQGKVIGGIILLIFGHIAIYKLGACLPEYHSQRPFNLLLWHAIEISLREGCTVFNMGSNSPHDTGLLRFKQSLGASHAPAYFYRLSKNGQPPDYTRHLSGFTFATAVWRRLPLSMTLFLSSRITTCF